MKTESEIRIELLEDIRRLIEYADSVEVIDHILLGLLTLERCGLSEKGEKK